MVLDGPSATGRGARRSRRRPGPRGAAPAPRPPGGSGRPGGRGCRRACHGEAPIRGRARWPGPGRPPPRHRGRRRRGPRRPAPRAYLPGPGPGRARTGCRAHPRSAPPPASRGELGEVRRRERLQRLHGEPGGSHVATWPRAQPEPSCWTSSHAEVAVRYHVLGVVDDPADLARRFGDDRDALDLARAGGELARLGERRSPLPRPVHARARAITQSGPIRLTAAARGLRRTCSAWAVASSGRPWYSRLVASQPRM